MNELHARRADVQVSPEGASRLLGRGNASVAKLREKTGATIEVDVGGERATAVAATEIIVRISGDPKAVAAAKREVG